MLSLGFMALGFDLSWGVSLFHMLSSGFLKGFYVFGALLGFRRLCLGFHGNGDGRIVQICPKSLILYEP